MQKGRPSYAYGEKLMKQMGWREGKGLGRNEDGNADFIKVKKKVNTKGIGFNGVDDRWVEHQEAFDSLLSQLSDGSTAAVEKKLISVEERAFKLGGRVHYSKFLRGKDLSQKKEEELNAIVIKRKKRNDEASVPEAEPKEETLSGVQTHTSKLSYQEYFTQRMAALRRQKGSNENKDWGPSCHTESNSHISEKECTKANPQEGVPLDDYTRISCLGDQECLKQDGKKIQKSIQSTFEESTPGGAIFANEHVRGATVVATEELDSVPRKPKKSKRKLPDSLTRTDGETEQFDAEAASQEVGPLDTCTRISCLGDQECSKQGRNKTRQKPIQCAFEESMSGGPILANKHADKATVLATEELDSVPRKPKKSKLKSADNLTKTERETEQFEAEAASQEVGSLGACTRISCLGDQECSKQVKKKTRQKSIQSAFVEGTPRGAMVANGHVSEATALATEELESEPQKPENSKRKSLDSLTRTDGEESVKKKQKGSQGDAVNGTKFLGSVTVTNKQSGEATSSVSEELECTEQQLSKKKTNKTSYVDTAKTHLLREGAVEKLKKKRRTPEDQDETSIEDTNEARGTGQSATFQDLGSTAHKPKKSKRQSGDNESRKDGLKEKDKTKLNRSNMEKVDVRASEACAEHCAPEKSNHKKKKGKEQTETERTTPGDHQEEAGSEVKKNAEHKQKRKQAVGSISDEQALKHGGKKLKLKREEKTETGQSRQQRQTAECAPKATQPEFLPGSCTSTTKQLGSSGSQAAVRNVPNREPPRRITNAGTRGHPFATGAAFKSDEYQEVQLKYWHEVGHDFTRPYKMPPLSYETAASMACWVVNTVEDLATRLTPNKVCHLTKDEYAELLGNHIYNRHRTTNWMQIPGYASSKLWLDRCVPHLVSSLRKEAQSGNDA